MVINIAEAKTNLSKLIDMAYHGEKITIAKNNLPLIDLIPHKAGEKRVLGPREGKYHLPDDFNAEAPEINALFYGSES